MAGVVSRDFLTDLKGAVTVTQPLGGAERVVKVNQVGIGELPQSVKVPAMPAGSLTPQYSCKKLEATVWVFETPAWRADRKRSGS